MTFEDKSNESPKLAEGQGRSIAAEFNDRSTDVSEIELKFLVNGNNPTAFKTIEKYFVKKGWVKLSRKNGHLLTRQLDTPHRSLLKHGHTLRIRGTCKNDNIDTIEHPDMCLKTGKTKDKSDAIRRGEYEARTRHFSMTMLSALKKKYPKEDYPELHNALKNVRPSHLREFFRIDCYRDRYIVELPQKQTGLKDKRFVAELIMDDVAFVMDIPGLKMPLIFYHDMEVECETLFKPCDYDDNPKAQDYVSSPMNKKELNHCMGVMRDHIMKASKGCVEPNFDSKAERGFREFDLAIDALKDFLEIKESTNTRKRKVRSALSLTSEFKRVTHDNDNLDQNDRDEKYPDLARHLPRRMGYVLRQRAIAYSK